MNNLELTYHGVITSKKNSKQIIFNRRSGTPMLISNRRAKQQENNMADDFQTQAEDAGWNLEAPAENVAFDITIYIWNKDHRRRDLDNQATAILDSLVASGVIPDDSCEMVPRLVVEYKGIDNEDPRAVIKIKETVWMV